MEAIKQHKKLSQLSATAICGNDITSSCLYVSALSIAYAGQYAWIALLMVSGVLFLFRKIYSEAVGALPLNGGAYNILLNTTSKTNASIAACLTILSYMATAVISASEAMHYLQHLVPLLPVISATVLVLTGFLILTAIGISESSKVAVAIFIFHLSSILLLIVFCGIYFANNGTAVLIENFHVPVNGSITVALFFGFSAAMLGISGFESSANFVEEQQPGVFPKTLRNMWLAVTLINPAIAFLAICIIPMAEVGENKEAFLSYIGHQTGGNWLATVISIDAVLVLSGAVLTSFVGVSGLMKRMTLDRILPQFLIKETKRGSSPRILLIFYLLCISILFITLGDLEAMAGVYTISFLTVMGYFAIGNLLLKIKRSRLPRPVYASPIAVFIAMLGIAIALYGNIKMHPEYLVVFLQYFVPAVIVVYALMNRNDILQFLLTILKSALEEMRKLSRLSQWIIRGKLKELHAQQFVFFSKADNISILNNVMIYIRENEITNRVKIVTVLKEGQVIPDEFRSDFEVLDRVYDDIEMEYVTLQGKFGPELIAQLSKEWNIPTNFMFISSPGDKFPYKVSELGGVRLIL